jgi:hypothetical protein
MRNFRILCFLALSAMLFAGCQKEEKSTIFSVSGYLKMNDMPVSGATLIIDELEQYKATSDANGYFHIDNVSQGIHKLKAEKKYSDNTYILKSSDLDVNTDISLDNLILPNPVSIVDLTLDSTNNKVTIRWNKSLAEDFREYKLYSHNTSGLDETTGLLEHVATDPSDTSVVLQMVTGSTLYYRVFTMNEYGQLGGSNVESISSVNINLFTGGDFEDEALFYSKWQVGNNGNGEVQIIDSISHDGNKCLLMHCLHDTILSQYGLCSIQRQPFLVEKNVEYEVSFWYKARGLAMMNPLNFNYMQDNQNYFYNFIGDNWPGVYSNGVKILEGVDWTYFYGTFIPNNNTAITFYFMTSVSEIYIDNLSLKKKLK